MDKTKADQILIEYLPKLYGFAAKKAFFHDEAEELCSEMIEEIYRSLLRADEIFNLDGYIWRISEHTYARHVSARKKQGIAVDSIDGMEIPYEEDFLAGEEAELMLLRREIAFLTTTRREIIYAFYYENKSVREISNQLGIAQGTIKWHLHMGREELKKGVAMERKIGRLGMKPIKAAGFKHSGIPGKLNPEKYLKDRLDLNIVYSVYFTPRTKNEIAEELGITPVFIEDRIEFLEDNSFLVRQANGKYTTYVHFSAETYSNELEERIQKQKLEIARILADEYAPLVCASIKEVTDVYIPGGSRELLEAAALFYGITNCPLGLKTDLSRYYIKTKDGGKFIMHVVLPAAPSDPEYKRTLNLPAEEKLCSSMYRYSEKYPAVSAWSGDTRYDSREGTYENNLISDYEAVYEWITGAIQETPANADKFQRLRKRQFLTADNQLNVMIVKEHIKDFFKRIPKLPENHKKKFFSYALETAQILARDYPPQMQDLIFCQNTNQFIGGDVALMVLDILYENGTFRRLTDREAVTSTLIMFSDVLPEGG